MRWIARALVCALGVPGAWAQGDASNEDIRVTCEFEDADLFSVLQILFDQLDVQYVLPAREAFVGAVISVSLDDAPLFDAMDSMLLPQGFAYEVTAGGVVVISADPVEAARRGGGSGDVDVSVSEILGRLERLQGEVRSLREELRAQGVAVAPIGQRPDMLTLHEDDESRVGGIRLTLIEVREGDAADDRDEDVVLIIDTPTSSEERTIEELRSELIDSWRVRVVDADAEEGRAILEIEDLGAERADRETWWQLRGQGEVAVRTLREDDEFIFRDLRVTLIEVEENDPDDDRDEDVRLIIDTLTSSEERTIEELRSEIVDAYRIRIVDADAEAGGFAEIEVTYLGEDLDRGRFGPQRMPRREPQFSRR